MPCEAPTAPVQPAIDWGVCSPGVLCIARQDAEELLLWIHDVNDWNHLVTAKCLTQGNN